MTIPIDKEQITKTTAQWESLNPILDIDVIGIEVMSNGYNRFKRGNGSEAWNSLPYLDKVYNIDYAANADNADTVDNKHASDFADSSHNHDTVYAPKSHSQDDSIHVTAEDKSGWDSKAAGSHTHGAGDITSGNLTVPNGGTGRATLTSGYFLRGNGTGTVTLSSPSAVLSAIGAAAAPTALYNNTSGTTGTITLSQSAANFLHMRIYYRDSDSLYGSVDVYSPNGKSLWLGTAALESHGTYFKRAAIQINANKITFTRNDEAAINGTSYNFYAGNYIYITRVEAWN